MKDMRMPDVAGTLDPKQLADMGKYLKEELDRIRRNPIKYGHPAHTGQVKIMESTSRRRLVVCANRWGKTEGMMRDVLMCARGVHPHRDIKQHSVIWIGSPDYPSYLRYHKPAFDQWCPPSWIVGSFHESEKYVDIRRASGGTCRIFFLSYDMPRSKWQGAGVDGIWLDEEVPEDLVKECLARIVTTRGWICLTFTPVSGVGWWYDKYYLPSMAGKGNWWVMQAALAERIEGDDENYEVGQSLVPHLTREEIIEFASDYPDPDERAIRVFGAVRGRTGLVYKRFSRDIHVIPRFKLPRDYMLWGALDPGYHGFAAILVGVSPQDRAYVVDEYFSQQETTATRFSQLADKVRALRNDDEWGHHDGPSVVFFVDTEDPQVVLELNTQASIAVENDMRAGKAPVHLGFVSLNQGLKARKAGFLRVQQVLAPDPRRKKPHVVERDCPVEGEPQIYFFSDLHSEWQAEDEYHRESRVIWELERYSWKKPPKGSTVQPDDADESSAGGAHIMATLRYIIMARLGEPEEEPEHDTRSGMSPMLRDVMEDFDEVERRLLDQLE